MANTPAKFPGLPTGLTITADVLSAAGAFLQNIALTEGSGNNLRTYDGTVTAAADGPTIFILRIGTNTLEVRVRDMEDTTTAQVVLSELDVSDLAAAVELLQPSASSGAFTVSITVTDLDTAAAIVNAIVRISHGGNAYTLQTDANGVAAFALDADTYTVAITKSGYSGHLTTLVVSGNASPAYTLDATQDITPPTTTATGTGYGITFDEEMQPESGVEVSLQMTAGTGTAGHFLDRKIRTVTSDNDGEFEFPHLAHGATYQHWRGGANSSNPKSSFKMQAVDTYALPQVLGIDPEA